MANGERQMANKREIGMTFFVLLLFSVVANTALAQNVSVSLTHPKSALLHIDSISFNEDWIELSGAEKTKWEPEDFSILRGKQQAEILSVDSFPRKFPSRLAISFVLDNSGSMFHAYDSLTKYCDTLMDSLPDGVIAQVVTFDDRYRGSSDLYTGRSSTFIARHSFTDTLTAIRTFWHFFDTIRTHYTPLYDAIAAAVTNISNRRMKGTSRNDALIIVTDGADNASITSIEMLSELLEHAHIALYAINFRVQDEGRLPWLARHTGGKYFLADGLPELHAILQKTVHSLSTQYRIRFRFPTLGPSSGK